MNGTETVFAILASAVVVAGGLMALLRAIWRVAQNIRDNTKATDTLSGKLDGLSQVVDGRITALESRVTAMERNRNFFFR